MTSPAAWILFAAAAIIAGVFAFLWRREADQTAAAEREKQSAQTEAARLATDKEEQAKKTGEISNDNAALRAKLEEDERRKEELRAANDSLRQNAARIAELETELAATKQNAADAKTLLEKTEATMAERFENLSQRIFDEKNRQFKEGSAQTLTPLRQNIAEFRARLDAMHDESGKERAALREYVAQLRDNANKVSAGADNLTRALKGDKKAQGMWGETQLRNLLEQSGLQEGRDYKEQESLLSDDNRRLTPDVIVNLPEDKHLLIDSKVSLVAYEEHVAADDDDARKAALARHVAAVKNHVKQLAEKGYPSARGVNAPDFIFLFMPIEPALLEALRAAPDLFADAYQRKVILTGPTTLMPVLKTAAHLWSMDRQRQNFNEIARQGGVLYDKFVGFVGDLEKIGKGLQSAQGAYDEAGKKLRSGRGNLFDQAEKLRDMGVEPKKELPSRDGGADAQ